MFVVGKVNEGFVTEHIKNFSENVVRIKSKGSLKLRGVTTAEKISFLITFLMFYLRQKLVATNVYWALQYASGISLHWFRNNCQVYEEKQVRV